MIIRDELTAGLPPSPPPSSACRPSTHPIDELPDVETQWATLMDRPLTDEGGEG